MIGKETVNEGQGSASKVEGRDEWAVTSTSVHCGRALHRNHLLQYRNHEGDFCA